MKRAHGLLAVAAALLLMTGGGCAMLVGTVSGPFMGAVDLPAATYHQNREAFDAHPMLFGLDALFMGPIGIALGAPFGLVKGLSLDIQWLIGDMRYGQAFGAYGSASVWRPFTIYWPERAAPPPPAPPPPGPGQSILPPVEPKPSP